MALPWESDYKIGHRQMDAQHLVLFSILNQLDININADLDYGSLIDILTAMKAYVSLHFANEEEVMRKAGYPQLTEHCQTHRTFLRQVASYEKSLSPDNALETALKVRSTVMTWLIDHILTVDADYAKYIAAQA